MRFRFRSSEEALAHAPMEFHHLAFEAIEPMLFALDAFAGTRESNFGRAIEHDVKSGTMPGSRELIELAQQWEIEPATVSLVGDGRIRISIRDDDFAGLDPGAQFLADVLRAIGKDQQQLGCDIERDFGIEENFTDRLAGARAARLMRNADDAALCSKRFGERRGLGGFPGTLDALPG